MAAVLTVSLAAMALAAVGGAGAAPPPPGPAELPGAEIIRPIGVEDGLLEGRGRDVVRVGVILTEQPVLDETTEPGFEAGLTGYTRGDLQRAAREDPAGVSMLEAQVAREAEQRMNAIGRELADESADLEREEERAGAILERVGGDVDEAAQSGPLAMVTAEIERRELADLAARNGVQAIVTQPEFEPELDTSRTTVAASSVFAQHSGGGDDGYGGASDVRTGIEVGLSSDTVNGSHAAFSGIGVNNGVNSPSAHGTATGGVVASRDATYRGVAPGISALRGGSADDWSVTDVDVRNESFGNYPNGNDGIANVGDLAAHTFMVPWAASAGNRNWDTLNDQAFPETPPGTSSTGGNAMGRNILSVGAIADGSTTSEDDDGVAIYSSWGPSPGGRKEPELVAPGTAITHPSVGGGIDTDSGTSLAAPHVAGAQAILVGAGMTDPRAIRAVLVNSAEPWCNGHYPGHDPPQGPALVDDPNPNGAPGAGVCQAGWEPDVGWGELDVANAVAQRGNTVIGDVGGGSVRFYRATVDPGERATLAWNMRGVLGPDVTQHVYYAVTNLNLRQYRLDGTSISPPADPGWGAGPDAVDPNDTTEQVRGPSPGGDVVYKVEAASSVEGAATERFGLASANSLTALANPTVEPVEVANSESGCEQNVQITAAARNTSGDIEAGTSLLSLELPAGVELVVGPQTQQVSAGILETNTTSDPVSWTVRPTTSGNHEVKIRGDGLAYGSTFSERKSVNLAADCGSPPSDPPPSDPSPPGPGGGASPQVVPNGLTLTPGGSPQCGTLRTVTAWFRNPTSTDAPQASGALAYGGGEVLDTASRTIGAGLLRAGEASGIYSWRLREDARSSTATVTGSTVYGGQSLSSPARISLSCKLTATTIVGDVRWRNGRLKVDGRLRFGGPTEVSIAGEEVDLSVERPGNERARHAGRGVTSETVALDRRGAFSASLGACRAGRYKVRASFGGARGYERAPRSTLGTERSVGC